jgi:glyoxylase-like metal-dependent hydrolase (beta-lactamase superfamily II)
VDDVVITHMHYDHAGTIEDYPQARLHLQEREMQFVAGVPMMDPAVRQLFELADVTGVVSALHTDRLALHAGDAEVAPGLSLHLVQGHTPGMQVVRVYTERGWVVLASDASHYYENLESARPFRIVHDVPQVHAAFRTILSLADSPAHFIPGHDPLVMTRYPAPAPALEGIAADLAVMPAAASL